MMPRGVLLGTGGKGRHVASAGPRFFCLLMILLRGEALAQTPVADSLEIEQRALAIRAAGITVGATDLPQRLTPNVTLTASFGSRDLVFFDASGGGTSLQPRDAFRITASLSLTGVFDCTDHEHALLERSRRQLELESEKARQSERRSGRIRRLHQLQTELELVSRELELCHKLERFYAILFEEGKVQFDALANARIRVLEVALRQERMGAEIQNIQENLP